MKREIDRLSSKRAEAFELWMSSPMPMVTIFKTLNVAKLVRISNRRRMKFNMLICWCIGKAASHTEEFYTLPVGDKLIEYDGLAINTVVKTKSGISTCDIPFTEDVRQFSSDYTRLTAQVYDTCLPYDLSDERMVIGTSALAKHSIDGAVNIYSGKYNNPYLIWGKYGKGIFKRDLPLSFQFHHTQMDGEEAAEFLDRIQSEVDKLKV